MILEKQISPKERFDLYILDYVLEEIEYYFYMDNMLAYEKIDELLNGKIGEINI